MDYLVMDISDNGYIVEDVDHIDYSDDKHIIMYKDAKVKALFLKEHIKIIQEHKEDKTNG